MSDTTLIEESRSYPGDARAVPAAGADAPPSPRRADSARPLVVDLDHSLLRTDLLHEAFWRRVAANPLSALAALFGRGGKAGLKRRLSDGSAIDVDALPAHEGVAAMARKAQLEGREVAFASASDRSVVEAVAKRFGVARTFASDGETNLRGEAKADALRAAYGRGGFDYVGDSQADFAVWDQAGGVAVVDPSPRMLARVRARYGEAQVIASEGRSGYAWLRAMRPHQWVKNLLVFLPVIAAHSASVNAWALSALGFAAFCACASGLYLINDMLDLDADRRHPSKRRRPIAAGDLSLRRAAPLAGGLFVLSALLSAAANPAFALVLLGYVVMSLAYSAYLKRVVLLDIVALSGFYVLRAASGGVASSVPLTVAFVALCFTLFFALAAVKRQTELTRHANGERRVAGRGYKASDIRWVTAAGLTASAGALAVLIAYGFVSPNAQTLYARPELLALTALPAGAWLARVFQRGARGKMPDDPVVYALRDRSSYAAAAAVLVVVAAAAL